MIKVISEFKEQHTNSIIDIFYRASLLAHPFLDKDFLEQEKTNIREAYLPAVETWIETEGDQIVGFLSLLNNEVMALFVAPNHHGKGFGKSLMDKAVTEKGDLEVVVFKNNAIGRHFYDRYGFEFMNEFRHEPSGQICLRLKYRANKNT